MIAAESSLNFKRVVTITAGLLCIIGVRKHLRRLRSAGVITDFHEGPGLIERDFTIRCPDARSALILYNEMLRLGME